MRPCFGSVVLTGFACTMGCSQREVLAPRTPMLDFDDEKTELRRIATPAETHPAGRPATWEIRTDPAAASPPSILALTHTENAGSTYNLLIFKEPRLSDLVMSVKVRADAGREDQGGGPIWRCKDADNYYICRLNPLEKNFRVYKVVAGKRTQLGTADTEALAGHWHIIKVRMVGSHIECFLNGQQLLTVDDGTFAEAGAIGLWTKADAASSFDDLTYAPAQ